MHDFDVLDSVKVCSNSGIKCFIPSKVVDVSLVLVNDRLFLGDNSLMFGNWVSRALLRSSSR